MIIRHCIACGANGNSLTRIEDNYWKCNYCGNVFEDDSVQKKITEMISSFQSGLKGKIDETIARKREEDIANSRYRLWEETHKEFLSNKEIKRWSDEIKKYLPKDFLADFYTTAISENTKEINAFLNNIDLSEENMYLAEVVRFMLKVAESENILPIENIIDAGIKDERQGDLLNQVHELAEKLNKGVYDTDLPRDVFIAYSGKDFRKVFPIVEELEANGISCFVAMRNLRHGKGAKERYREELYKAMNSCECFVFLSSKNSRQPDCDAIKVEMPYFRDYQKEKPRIEYVLDNERNNMLVELKLKKFFEGQEYCRTIDDLLERIGLALERSEVSAEKTEEVKYCVECLKEANLNAKFCPNCGKTEFAETLQSAQQKHDEIIKQRLYEEFLAEQKRKEEEKKAEAKRIEELERQREAKLEEERRQIEELRKQKENTLEEERRRVEELRRQKEAKLEEARLQEERKRIEEELAMIKAEEDKKREAEEQARAEEERIRQEEQAKEEERIRQEEQAEKERQQKEAEKRELENGFLIENGVLIKYKGPGGDVHLPDCITCIGKKAFHWNDSIKHVTIPNSVTSIEQDAFFSCESLIDISIPSSVKAIGGSAFYDCKALKSVYYSGDIASWCTIMFKGPIADSNPLFYAHNLYINNTLVTEVTIHKTGIEAKNSLFSGWSGTKVTISDGVVKLGFSVFEGCKNLETITIPGSLTSFGNDFLKNCSKLSKIIYLGTPKQWKSVFKGISWDKGTGEYTIECHPDGEDSDPSTIAVVEKKRGLFGRKRK